VYIIRRFLIYVVYRLYCVYLCSLNSGIQNVKFGRIFRFILMCLLPPVIVQAGEMHDPAVGNGLRITLFGNVTRFAQELGFTPSAGFGISITLPVKDFSIGAAVTTTSTGLPFDAVGTVSTLPVALTSAMIELRHDLWRPGSAFAMQAGAEAGALFISTGAQTISLGALGVRTLPARSEVRSIVGLSLPLQLKPADRLLLEFAPAASWILGPSGPFATYALSGGLGVVIN
jgi:hypothetical protein